MTIDEIRECFFDGVTRYRWLGTLGRGAVGVIFKAKDLTLDEVVAIKVLSPDVERDDEQLLARFKREISLNRKIKHPNVARMFDFGISGDFPYITMELVEGKDLWTVVEERGALPPAEAVAILRQIARGAGAIHRLGIVHRDLKSENVLIDRTGAAVILDFGLARSPAGRNVTLRATLLGTPHYMAPEQAMGKPVDPRSDVYSIGVIAYELLTGRLPFTAKTPMAVAMKQVSEPAPRDLLERADLPRGLARVVYRALEKDPVRRFATASDLETALALLGTTEAPATEVDLSREVDRAFESLLAASTIDGVDQALPPSPDVNARPLALVVADDVRDLLRLATKLCQAGCRTLEVRSGEDALAALAKRRVDLVVLHADLPVMDGFDLTRRIRSQKAYAALPILLLASRPDRALLAFAMQLGAAELLGRPVTSAALAESIWRLLSHRGFRKVEDMEAEG